MKRIDAGSDEVNHRQIMEKLKREAMKAMILKEIKSMANLTRRDVQDFLELAAEIKITPEVQLFPLEAANQALMELKESRIRGAKVLRIE